MSIKLNELCLGILIPDLLGYGGRKGRNNILSAIKK